MDEAYRIEVLHIVSPHLMYVEAQSKTGPVIEQIGIFGVLPISKTIDIDGNVLSEWCENWPVAANTILREFLADHKNSLYFRPIEVNERSTILDDKTHIFGDIVSPTEGDLSATKYLVKLGVAVEDEHLFHQKLASGKIKIKQNSHRNEEVLLSIKRYYKKQKKVEHDWRKTLKQQTYLYEEGKKIVTELTEKNLKLFESKSPNMQEVNKTIERKKSDLDLCKDASMVSVGCGISRNRTKKHDLRAENESAKDGHKPFDILNNVKKYVEVKGRPKDVLNSHSTTISDEQSNLENTKKDRSTLKHSGRGRHILKFGRGRFNRHSLNYDRNCASGLDFSETDKFQTSSPQSKREKASRHQVSPSQKAASPPEPKERNIIYCPDMELSNTNCNKFVKVIDNFASGTAPFNPVAEVIETDTSISHDDGLYSKINLNITNLDRIKTENISSIVKSPDQTDAQTKLSKQNDCKSDNKSYPQFSHSESRITTQNDTGKGTAKAGTRLSSSLLQKKLQVLREAQKRKADNPFSSNSDTSVRDISSSSDQSKIEPEPLKAKIEPRMEQRKFKMELDKTKVDQKPLKIKHEQSKIELAKIESKHTKTELKQSKIESEASKVQSNQLNIKPKQPIQHVQPKHAQNIHKVERNVNPFKNFDGSKSVFVEKLITPILMVHTKNDNLILPRGELRDIPFKLDVHRMLKNMRVHKPMRIQSVSWSYILRGHSLFMISPSGNGKTIGYVPAVCNLVSDFKLNIPGQGPVCIIVCATSLSVTEVENYCKGFLGLEQRIVACYTGIETGKITTALLNGCHVLICTAPMLVSLLELDFGVDLRRLLIIVLEDCERLAQVYTSELNKFFQHVKNMLKNRSDKSLKVQYVVASRQWCDFMTPLARKVPDTVIAIGASQEIVLYSKAQTSVNFVKSQESKVNTVVEFMKEINASKRTIIVCREDDEVVTLERTLTKSKHTVFACNNTMTLHELYNISEAWADYQEPVSGPVLICCDGNLTHLNITNANYLVHFSMPALFSMFCKRFSVLNENYASIFQSEIENVKIKILLDETNVEQLPKILNFVKRCTNEVFPALENVLQAVLQEKDLKKAEELKPICNNLLMLGDCIDKSNCPDRHTVFKEFDEPKHWMPKRGVITFKITQIDSATTYSARVLTNTTNSETTKYPNNYNTLSLKMGMYYSKEINRKLHGKPKIRDICAVVVKQNFFERCLVLKVIQSDDKKSNHVLINLLDQEQLTITKDVNLYYMPDELKYIETHMVKVRLANIQPKDKDVTFSVAAKNLLQKIFERDNDNTFYARGRVLMILGNCIFVDTLECCIDLSSLGETVVTRDLKKELLERHAELNPQHFEKLKKLSGSVIVNEKSEPGVAPKVEKRPKWAHLDKDDLSTVFFTTAVDAGTFFVRQAKFKSILGLLLKDIHEYVEKAPELVKEEIYVGNIVLAEYPDDKVYERARIDAVVDDSNVKCFFVDNGDWRQVSAKKLRLITDSILHRLPFQAIECRLVGVKPPGNAEDWPEFSTSWLDDYCFEDSDGNAKYLFIKYFTKEKAKVTGGHKYGVALFDTSSNEDVVINKLMIELNLAKEIEDETKYIEEPLNIKPVEFTDSSLNEDVPTVNNSTTANGTSTVRDLVPLQPKENYWNETNSAKRNVLLDKPIRSVPLVNSDSESDISGKWDVNIDKKMLGMFGQPSKSNITEHVTDKDAPDEDKNITTEKPMTSDKSESVNIAKDSNGTSSNKMERATINGKGISSVSKPDNNKGVSESVLNSPTLVSQCDSDDLDIGKGKAKALNLLRNKLFNIKFTEKSPNKADLEKTENDGRVSSFENETNDTLDSDDLSSASELPEAAVIITECTEVELARTPKLIWRQDKKTVTMKIILIGVEDYVLEIKDRSLRFQTWHNDTTYEFDFVLYGVIKADKSTHSNKGQYILVTLVKMLERSWLNLTKDCSNKKWIAYDVDAIEISSDEDDSDGQHCLKAIKQSHEKQDTESEDDDFDDDMSFRYKRDLDD